MDTQPLQAAPPSDHPATIDIDFGPYTGRDVAFVAVADPGYLLELVREGVGSDALRAEAARELAQRARLVPPGEPWPVRGAATGAAPLLAVEALRTHPIAGLPPDGPTNTFRQRAGSALVAAATCLARWLVAARPWQLAVVAAAMLAVVVVTGRLDPWASGADGATTAVSSASQADALARPPAQSAVAAIPSSSGSAARRQPTLARPGDAPASAGADGVATARASAPCGARVAGAIPAESAGDYLDTFQAVEFEVVQAKDTGKVTFLNSHIPYAGAFYVAIFPDDYAAFPEPPATFLAGRCIVVQGTIEIYRGAPQIVLRHPDDLRVVEEPPSAPAEPIRPAIATTPAGRPAR